MSTHERTSVKIIPGGCGCLSLAILVVRFVTLKANHEHHSRLGGCVRGEPTGSPVDIATMLEFAARHGIAPQTEHFPLSQVNEALAHLRAGRARYRIVLDAGGDVKPFPPGGQPLLDRTI